jgi:hypothetical protein
LSEKNKINSYLKVGGRQHFNFKKILSFIKSNVVIILSLSLSLSLRNFISYPVKPVNNWYFKLFNLTQGIDQVVEAMGDRFWEGSDDFKLDSIIDSEEELT